MKVLSFGELLLRLAAPGYTRLLQKDRFDATFCGGEANVAVSLAILGIKSEFLTKLPENDIATAAIDSLRQFGVGTQKIVRGLGRMGLYYLEKGASQRPSKVIYDRKYSSIAMAAREDFDWDLIMKDVDWFHWTGITPALSDNLADIIIDACTAAKKRGIKISCDLNYRKTLWNVENARETMRKLMVYTDVCIANEEDADKALGIEVKHNDVENGVLNRNGYQEAAREIHKRFGCEYIAFTLRESISATVNDWSGMLFDAKTDTAYYSNKYTVQIVDRVGSGDSFAAGLIYSLITDKSCADAVQFATAASCLKHSIEGDFNRVSKTEIEDLIINGGNGRVKR